MTAAAPGADERAIRASQTAEADWRSWLMAQHLPALELIPSDRRLLVVAPHPDDEILGCGGLMQRHAQAGGSLLVVAVTDGEASHPGDVRWPPDALAAERRTESTRGLAELGLPAAGTVRLAFPDGAVASRGDDLVEALSELVRPGDTVLTTWRLDGHPDHEATGAACARVALERGCRLLEAPVWMWHWSRPDDARVPWPRLTMLALGAEEQAAKRRALALHATQLAPQRDGAAGPVLDAAILARAQRPFECFFV